MRGCVIAHNCHCIRIAICPIYHCSLILSVYSLAIQAASVYIMAVNDPCMANGLKQSYVNRVMPNRNLWQFLVG